MVVTLATQVGHTCGLMVTQEAVMGHLVGPDELVDIGDPADAVAQDEHSYYHTGHTRQTDLEQGYKPVPTYFNSAFGLTSLAWTDWPRRSCGTQRLYCLDRWVTPSLGT